MSERDYLIAKAFQMPKLRRPKSKPDKFVSDDWGNSWSTPKFPTGVQRFDAPSPKIKPAAPVRTPAQQERNRFAAERANDAKAAAALKRDRSAKEFARYSASQSRSRGGF